MNSESSLQLMVSGKSKIVEKFWGEVKGEGRFCWEEDYRSLFAPSNENEHIHVVMRLQEQQFPHVTLVMLKIPDGRTITIPLMDVNVAKMLDGKVCIHGKSYDIFAAPVREGE